MHFPSGRRMIFGFLPLSFFVLNLDQYKIKAPADRQ